MNAIRMLPDRLINQIAAGEVVERPISVIKELFENSVDAGASKITITLENGGKTLIRITDNGSGISAIDLPMAIERHATSKLNDDNLSSINTHGFRGEALPSIASVSHLTITSKTKESESAYKISIDYGTKSEMVPASHNVGTTIEVRNLFAALPARLKFLKSEKAERNLILEFIEHMSLCYTNVDISLISDDEELFNSCATESLTKEKLTSVFGAEFASNMVEIDSHGTFSITGFIGLPTYMRPNASTQIFFVNNRLVKDKVLYRAIKVAYQNLMMLHKHAACVLKFTFDPYDIDVNVHPAKTEIRFYEADKVIGIIANAIRTALSRAHIKPTPVMQQNQAHLPSSNTNQRAAAPNFIAERNAPTFRHIPANVVQQSIEEPKEEPMLGYAIMQINNTYILARSKQGLIIVDQHAAHERINLEKFKQAAKDHAVKKQHLTVPVIVDLSTTHVSNLCEMQTQLSAFGFDIERNGLTQVSIHAVPTIFNSDNAKDFINDIASELQNDIIKEDYKKFFDVIMGNIACKMSIKAGDQMSLYEMNNLLRDIENTDFAGECNHGRPTFLLLDERELAKLFCRI